MAEEADDTDKTEDPSQHRIDESRRKGEVGSSKELNSVLVLGASFFCLILSFAYIFEVVNEVIDYVYNVGFEKAYTDKELTKIITLVVWSIIRCSAPIFLGSLLLGVFSSVMQVGFLFAPEALKTSFSRVNPMSGFKRLFSKKSVAETIKGLFKFVVIFLISYSILKVSIPKFLGFYHVEYASAYIFGKTLLNKVFYSILSGLFIIALADFAWQKYQHKKKLMVTKQQAREESKDKDGNPEVKQRIKSIQREMSQQRMMNDVPTADAIVTNPTHYSVAIKYDKSNMLSPKVIAKGKDFIALKIREVAKKNKVPVIENVTLARSLYGSVKVGEYVPRTLYKAVAEVLAFVYKLKRKRF